MNAICKGWRPHEQKTTKRNHRGSGLCFADASKGKKNKNRAVDKAKTAREKEESTCLSLHILGADSACEISELWHSSCEALPAQSLVGGSGGGGGQLLSEAALIAPISGLCSFALSRWDKAARNESLQATHGIFTKTHACVLQIPDASCPCFSSAVVFLIAILESLTLFVSSQWVTWAERTYMHTVTGNTPVCS